MRRRRTMTEDGLSRREFVWKAACAAVGFGAMADTIYDLRLMNAAIAQAPSAVTDYKALVCLFLFGGNDANNFIVPTDPTTYAQYQSARGILALDSSTLQTINPPGDGHTYG